MTENDIIKFIQEHIIQEDTAWNKGEKPIGNLHFTIVSINKTSRYCIGNGLLIKVCIYSAIMCDRLCVNYVYELLLINGELSIRLYLKHECFMHSYSKIRAELKKNYKEITFND